VEEEGVPSKEGQLASASKDMNADLEDCDPDDYDLDAVGNLEDPPCNVNQQTAIARAATRIALYMMREELGDSVLGEKQHAHDFFVVNSCKVYCKMKQPPCIGLHRSDKQGVPKVMTNVSKIGVNNCDQFKMDVNQSTTFSEVWSGARCEGSQGEHIMEQCEKPVFSEQAVDSQQGEVCSSKQQVGLASTNQSRISSTNNQPHKNEAAEAMVIDETSQTEQNTMLDAVCKNQGKNIEEERTMKQDSFADQVGKCVSSQSQVSQSEIEHTNRDGGASILSPSKDDKEHVSDSLLPITHKEAMKVLEEISR